MWDNPRQLNAAAGFLTALALPVLALAAGLAVARSPLFPLREIVVAGAPVHTSRDAIERAIEGRLRGNFFAVDLAEVRAGLEQLPWVRRVQVRRLWPDRLEVTLAEHVPLARWDAGGLVNLQGERFAGSGGDGLPGFAGPDGSEADVTRRFRAFVQILAPLGVAPERVVLTPRHAWRVRLNDGLAIELGRDAPGDPVEARLSRLVEAYPQSLARMARKPEYVDLRYPNGFALRVAGTKDG